MTSVWDSLSTAVDVVGVENEVLVAFDIYLLMAMCKLHGMNSVYERRARLAGGVGWFSAFTK